MKYISFNENYRILIQISLKFNPNTPAVFKSALAPMMDWRATNHYMNQWWHGSVTHACVNWSIYNVIFKLNQFAVLIDTFGLQWVNASSAGIYPKVMLFPGIISFQMHDIDQDEL